MTTQGLSTSKSAKRLESHNSDIEVLMKFKVQQEKINFNQRNKIEVFDKYIFAVQKYTYVEDSILKTDTQLSTASSVPILCIVLIIIVFKN